MFGIGVAVALFRHHRRASQPVNRVENAAGRLGSKENKFADYVGSESCRNCHAVQYAHWAKSNHAFAERPVRSEMDRDAFEPGRTIKHGSQTSQVRIQDGRFQIITLGLHSNVEPYQVERVIGHAPLRQLLTLAPGGRWQVHELAYHPASNDWFDVYGSEDRQPGEYAHWTGRGMNWNSRCADCHNTRLLKNHDAANDTYQTTMAEMGVGCEACHGPLKGHLEWRKKYPNSKRPEPAPPVVRRSQTMDVCGACHSRRDELTGGFKPGESYFDHFSLEILDENGRWFPDGQVKEEDYEFASFLGSRMFQGGVHCRDCHRPDSGTGNNLCMRCHQGSYPGFTNAPVINPVEHGHHKINDKGAECVGCHMPVTVYMQRHPRHDHGFTIPDPLLTRQQGIPNACARCHGDKSVDWALENTEKWYGAKMNRHSRERARWIAAALQGEDSEKQRLTGMLATSQEPPYWRAVAANLLWRWAGDGEVKAALLGRLNDEHPLVREKAVRALESLVETGDVEVTAALREMLKDAARNVRVAAAWVLRATLDMDSRAGRELQLALSQDDDQPLGQYKQALLQLARNQPADALAHLQKAIAWDPFSPPFRCTTAVVLNQMGRTSEALEMLSQAEKLSAADAQIPYARATILARAGRVEEAEAAARQAIKMQPDFEPARQLLQQLEARPK